MITRKLTRDIGFINISDSFVHYKNGVDSSKLLDDLCKIMKVTRQSTNKPHYICGSIESDILIECIIADIVPNEQYQKDLVKILTALQIRNLLEKKIIAKIPTIANPSLKKCAVILEGTYGTKEPLLVFLKANKFMVDEFAHLESGLDALLTYDIDYIQEQLVLLKQII
jgi:hypothetical protein